MPHTCFGLCIEKQGNTNKGYDAKINHLAGTCAAFLEVINNCHEKGNTSNPLQSYFHIQTCSIA